MLNKESILSQNKTNQTKTAKLSPLFISQIANTPAKKDDISANIRDSNLRTDLGNEQDSIDRRECISAKSLSKHLFEESYQQSRQEYYPSHTKVISKPYVWSEDEDSDDDQLKLNQGKLSNVTPLNEDLSYSYDKNVTSLSDNMSSKSYEEDDYQLNLDNDVENNLNVLSSIFSDMLTSKPKTVDMIHVTDKTDIDRILSHHGEISNFDRLMTRYDPTMDSTKKYEIVSKDYDDARNTNISEEDGSHCSKNIDINPITSNNTSHVIDQNEGSDLKLQTYDEESSCYDKGKKTVHIYEETKLDNIFHDARTGVEMIGINVANTTSAKKDDIKADTFREINLKIDLENEKDSGVNRICTTKEGNEIESIAKKAKSPEKNIDIKRRKGFILPINIIAHYENCFFEMNDGVGSIKKYEISQNQWQEERKKLTLDWKSKHRHASKIRKKKFQR